MPARARTSTKSAPTPRPSAEGAKPSRRATSLALASTGAGPRESRRLQRIQTSRNQILDSAEELFSRYGYQGTSLELVASGSEFSVGGLYSFFASKEKLFLAVLDRRGDELRQRMRICLEVDVSGEAKLLLIASEVIKFLRERPDFGRLSGRVFSMSRDRYPTPDVPSGGHAWALDIYSLAIEQGQREGTFRAGNPRKLAHLIIGLINAQTEIDPELSSDPEGIALDEFLEIVRGALGRGGNSRKARAEPRRGV
jgi:AcrR family transcriptional regulator